MFRFSQKPRLSSVAQPSKQIFKTKLRLNKKGVTHLEISYSTPVHHTVKVPKALCMELYRSAQYEGIERTDLFS